MLGGCSFLISTYLYQRSGSFWVAVYFYNAISLLMTDQGKSIVRIRLPTSRPL